MKSKRAIYFSGEKTFILHRIRLLQFWSVSNNNNNTIPRTEICFLPSFFNIGDHIVIQVSQILREGWMSSKLEVKLHEFCCFNWRRMIWKVAVIEKDLFVGQLRTFLLQDGFQAFQSRSLLYTFINFTVWQISKKKIANEVLHIWFIKRSLII